MRLISTISRRTAVRSLLIHGVSVATLALIACVPVAAEDAAVEAEAKTETVDVFGIGSLTVPAEFKRAERQSRIIDHEFQATSKKVDRPARLTMMGASGGVEANIKRWKGQFSGGDPEAQKVKEMKIGDWTVHMVDVSGSYAESMGGGPFSGGKVVQRENYAMAGAILVEPKGRTFFVKLIGPAEVIADNHEAFVKMIKSIEK
ncbi:hypothetical protein [Stieleria varia]|uniref:Uncharacterized protein n=1 Tax=Stieleria varia TaxID=2528005 RepID=A0A5C5ZYP4_9BACT|nr:hypothetical protein [Stieleria varia]TWT92742.1 hypothetical protein Pla52n_61070 [Stieleria varia]